MTIQQRSLWMHGRMHGCNLSFEDGIFVKSGFNKSAPENTSQIFITDSSVAG